MSATAFYPRSTSSGTGYDDERRSFTFTFNGPPGWSTGLTLGYAKQVVNVYVREFGQFAPAPVADLAVAIIGQQLSIDVLSNGESTGYSSGVSWLFVLHDLPLHAGLLCCFIIAAPSGAQRLPCSEAHPCL